MYKVNEQARVSVLWVPAVQGHTHLYLCLSPFWTLSHQGYCIWQQTAGFQPHKSVFSSKKFFFLVLFPPSPDKPLRDTGYIIYILLCCDSSLYVSGCLCFISERSPHSWDRDVCNLLSICLFTVFPFADKVNCYVTVLIDFGFLNRKHFYQLSHYYLYWCETMYIYIFYYRILI